MKNYYRVMLGEKSKYAEQCFTEGFIGADYGVNQNLSELLSENYNEYYNAIIPIYRQIFPAKSKIAAGLNCGALWTIAKGIQIGDRVLCPDGNNIYWVGEITSDYHYESKGILQHRRSVKWLPTRIERNKMSQPLRNLTAYPGTVVNISDYHQEIESFITEIKTPSVSIANELTFEDPIVFAMENHLEDFLVRNWGQTQLGQHYEIYQESGQQIGKQYITDAGNIDILAISKDKKRLLVVELKRGRTSDQIVGQILRYIGFVQDKIAENNQTVEGVIIALDDDHKLRWALKPVPFISLYCYQIRFDLFKKQ